MIDEQLAAGTSSEIDGLPSAPGWAAAQCIRVADAGSFRVELEHAIIGEGEPVYWPVPVGVNNEQSVLWQGKGSGAIYNFPVIAGCRYRFKHVSGVACRVLFTA